MSEHYDQREALHEVRIRMPTKADEITALKMEAALWKEAYENMKDFALSKGLDINTYN